MDIGVGLVGNLLDQKVQAGLCDTINVAEAIAAGALGALGVRDFIPIQPNLASDNLAGQLATEVAGEAVADALSGELAGRFGNLAGNAR